MLAFASLAVLALLHGAAALPGAGSGAFQSNLAYLSPSTTVSELAVPLDTVVSRLGKRWADTYQGNLSFPYGVASGDREYLLWLLTGGSSDHAGRPAYSDSAILWTMPRKVGTESAWPAI